MSLSESELRKLVWNAIIYGNSIFENYHANQPLDFYPAGYFHRLHLILNMLGIDNKDMEDHRDEVGLRYFEALESCLDESASDDSKIFHAADKAGFIDLTKVSL